MVRIARVAALMLMGGLLSGCVPLVMEAAQRVWEARSAQDQFQDAAIYTGILNGMLEMDPTVGLEVSVDVWEGRVLLTGKVSDPVLSSELEYLVRKDKRVRSVYNRVHLAGREKSRSSFLGDVWVETEVMVKLLAEEGVSSVNYRWQSVGGEVYIMGRAKSAKERAAVLRVVRGIKGVHKVQDFIEVGLAKAPASASR